MSDPTLEQLAEQWASKPRPICDPRPFTVVTSDGIPWTVTGKTALKFRAMARHD